MWFHAKWQKMVCSPLELRVRSDVLCLCFDGSILMPTTSLKPSLETHEHAPLKFNSTRDFGAFFYVIHFSCLSFHEFFLLHVERFVVLNGSRNTVELSSQEIRL